MSPVTTQSLTSNLLERRKHIAWAIKVATAEDTTAMIENRPPSNLQLVLLLNQEINVIDAAIQREADDR